MSNLYLNSRNKHRNGNNLEAPQIGMDYFAPFGASKTAITEKETLCVQRQLGKLNAAWNKGL
jgi:hypothetical protein